MTVAPAANAGLVAEATTIKDPKNDLVDENGKKAARAPHIDLTRLDAAADGTELRMSLTMAGNVPPEMSSIRQELTYLVIIEADASGEMNYWVTLGKPGKPAIGRCRTRTGQAARVTPMGTSPGRTSSTTTACPSPCH